MTDTPPAEPAVYAIVEQYGHRRFGAAIREVTRFGATFMEATTLTTPPHVMLLGGASIFALTQCDEATARRVYARGLDDFAALPARVEREDDIPFTVGQRADIAGVMDRLWDMAHDVYGRFRVESGTDELCAFDFNPRLCLSMRLRERGKWDVEIIDDHDGTHVVMDCDENHDTAAEALVAFESEHLSDEPDPLDSWNTRVPRDDHDSLPPPPVGVDDF